MKCIMCGKVLCEFDVNNCLYTNVCIGCEKYMADERGDDCED